MSNPMQADYDEFISAWRYACPATSGRPKGVFPPKNFMASEILSYHKLPGGLWAEVSWGDFMGSRSIGITVAAGGSGEWKDRSRGVEVFDDMGEAADYLRSLMSGQS